MMYDHRRSKDERDYELHYGYFPNGEELIEEKRHQETLKAIKDGNDSNWFLIPLVIILLTAFGYLH